MNKRCIPLIFSNNYQPDGWLNSVIGFQSYVNFSQFQLAESLDYLIKEIEYKQPNVFSLSARNDCIDRKQSVTLSISPKSGLYLNTSHRDSSFLNAEYIPYIDSLSNQGSRSDINIICEREENLIEHETPVECQESENYTGFEPIDWSQDDVKEWYLSSAFGDELEQFLKDFDGKTLHNLFCTRNDAPEYFYRTVSQDNRLSFQTVSKFITCIEQLFSK